jgi:hypothetical protein
MASSGTGLTLSQVPWSRAERTFIRSALRYTLTHCGPSIIGHMLGRRRSPAALHSIAARSAKFEVRGGSDDQEWRIGAVGF